MIKDTKDIYRLTLVICLFVLALVIAVCHIEEKTSFGLRDVITILGMLASQAMTKETKVPETKPMDVELPKDTP